MATEANTARRDEWERAFKKLTELNRRLEQAQPHERDQLERAVAEQEEDLLDTPAPSFSAVLSKLYVLWDGQLFGIDAETEAKRLILEDLEDLIRSGAELLVSDIETVPVPVGWPQL